MNTDDWYFERAELCTLSNMRAIRIWYMDENGRPQVLAMPQHIFFRQLMSEPRRPNEGTVTNLVYGGLI